MSPPIPVTEAMLKAAGIDDAMRFDPSMRSLPTSTVKRMLWTDRYRAMAGADASRVQASPDQEAVRQALREAQDALTASQAALALAMQFITMGEAA